MKTKLKLQKVCATDASGRAPFIEALRAARRLALPAKTFYWLNKISQVVEKEFVDYEAARIKLVMKLGTKVVENGKETGGYRVSAENQAAFDQEMATLNREVDLPLDEGVKLALPANGVADDWFLLMTEMDIFVPPPES